MRIAIIAPGSRGDVQPYLALGVAVRPALGQPILERGHVQPKGTVCDPRCARSGVPVQADGLLAAFQPPFAQGFAERRQVAAQAGAGLALIVFGIEQGGQRVTAVFAVRHRQVGQECDDPAAANP